MNKLYCLIGCIFLAVGSVWAQVPAAKITPSKVQGMVKIQASDEPAIGASIIIKGTQTGTIADIDGNFTLDVAPTDTLICSFVGHEKSLIPVGGRSMLMINLQPSSQQLDGVEVVAVGYGTIDRAKLSGSVASLKGAELNTQAVSIDNALSGKLSGVMVTSTSGQPGSASAITIRGISTFQKDGNNPLFVIDGVPIYGSNSSLNSSNYQDQRSVPAAGFGGTNVSNTLNTESEFERNPLAHLNPEDIESIEVLKDAYATAIYGSRGAAGVIIVQTKKGKKGAGQVNLKYEVGVDQPVNTPDLLSGYEYGKLYSEYYRLQTGGLYVKFDTVNNVNWLDKVIRPAITQRLNVSLVGGGDKSRYYTSLSAHNLPSYVVGNDFKKYTARINYEYDPAKNLTTGANMQFSHTNNSALNAQRVYYNAVRKAPNVPIQDTDGAYIWRSDEWKGEVYNKYGEIDNNPVAVAEENINYLKDNRVIGNLFLKYRIGDWLVLMSEGGIDILGSEAYSREKERPQLIGGSAVQTTRTNVRTVFNNTLTINKSFQKHDLDVVLGYSFESSKESNNRLTGAEFFDDDLLSIGASGAPLVAQSAFNEWALESYFARINYLFDSRYILGVTYRLDGSSKFAKNNQYVGFPSFSVGWIPSESLFLRRYTWIENLKVRASFGFSGINAAGQSYYGTQGVFDLNANSFTYGDVRALEIKQPVNPNLKWEKTQSFDVGMDATLFEGRVDMNIDYYYKLTRNLLFSSTLSPYKGFTSIQQNIGSMQNSGIELTLNTNFKFGQLYWTSSFNIAQNKNKILELNYAGDEVNDADFNYKYMREGEEAGQYFLFEWGGVNPDNGQALWVDKDGNTIETPTASLPDPNSHRKPYGTSLPDFFGGFNNTFTYKSWSLNAFFNFSIGGQLFNGTRASLLTYTTADATNLSDEIQTYWKEEGDITDVPKLKNLSIVGFSGDSKVDYLSSRTNSRFLEENSFIRLKSISLTYSFPKSIVSRLSLTRLQCYMRATNLWTWATYSGNDPEVTMGGSSILLTGIDEITMPQVRSVSLGINMSF